MERFYNDGYHRLVSLREISRRLNMDPVTIKRHAAKAGLKYPRKAVRPTRRKPAGPKPKKSRLEYHERRWEQALVRRAETSIRARLATSYNYLFRNDKAWLMAHQAPRPPAPKPQKGRVDWKLRDERLAAQVRELATGPTGIRSAGKIRAAFGLGNILRKTPSPLFRNLQAGFQNYLMKGFLPSSIMEKETEINWNGRPSCSKMTDMP